MSKYGGVLNGNPFLGKRIAYQRENLGLTQSELARKVGTKPKYISTLETGRKTPGPLMLARIAAALGVTMDELNRNEKYL